MRDKVTAAPVCVDLDGTLIAGDILWESFVALFQRSPLAALQVSFSLAKGRAHFKKRVAEYVPIDPAALPYRTDLLEELKELNQQGVPLVLATATHETYAWAIADHLKIFQQVIASDGRRNLSGHQKAASLVERFGERGFDYIGNGWSDVPVWRAAAGVTVVAGPARLVRQLTSERSATRVLARRRSTLEAFLTALRPNRWAANTLVFVPLVAGLSIPWLNMLASGILTFVAFSLCASATYILDDISDIQTDRLDSRKHSGPFASGELSIPAGVAAAGLLLTASLLLAALGVSWLLAAILGVYVVVSTAHTLRGKQTPAANVLILTGLHVLRIMAGAVAMDWL